MGRLYIATVGLICLIGPINPISNKKTAAHKDRRFC